MNKPAISEILRLLQTAVWAEISAGEPMKRESAQSFADLIGFCAEETEKLEERLGIAPRRADSANIINISDFRPGGRRQR